MISRFYFLVGLIGLALAAGAGWGVYELRRERAGDAPVAAAGAPAEVADAGEPAAADPRADPPAPASPSGETPSAAAPAPPGTTPAPPSAPETVTSATGAPEVGTPDVGTGAQIEAVSSAAEAQAPAAPLPDLEPAEAAEVAAAAAVAEAAPAPAETAGEPGGTTAGPAGATTGAAALPREPDAEAEDAPEPDAQETLAASAPIGQQGDAPPTPSGTTGRPGERQPAAAERPEESGAAPARAAETIRQALSALFGSAPDASGEGADDGSAGAPAPPAAAPDQAGATDRSDPAAIAPEAGPTFDIVRIAPGGQAVIAGRAAPDAEVEIKSGDRVVDRVRADRRGEWVAVPPAPLSAGDQALSLLARAKDGSAAVSDEVLVVAVPEPPPPQPAPRAGAEPPPPQPPEVAAGQSPSAALAMALPRDGRSGGRILQAPGRLSGDGALALMVVDYDESGQVRLRGEAPPGAPLRIYVDNAPAGTAVVGPSGAWSTVLEPTLAPGDYMLRLDQLDSSGKPTARLETPFTRASRPPVEGDLQVDFVVVQPGNSLWRIARRLYGHGMHYVHIYDANDGQIRDPDLIYPGQVFEMPSQIGAAG